MVAFSLFAAITSRPGISSTCAWNSGDPISLSRSGRLP
jgi:hypothetical protein